MTIGNECGVEAVNESCLNPNTVCSQVANGFKRCLCDRNYGKIDGQCRSVPNKLFEENFVNETISRGENITIDYQLRVLTETLDTIRVEIIPNLPNYVENYYITEGIRLKIFNTQNIPIQTFMIRMTADYGGVKIQDSTLVNLQTKGPVIEYCPTAIPQRTPTITNVKLGNQCGFDNNTYPICVEPYSVCPQKVQQGIVQQGICQCDKNHAEIDKRCVELPNRLFKENESLVAIPANIQPDKVLYFDLNVKAIYLSNTTFEMIPTRPKIKITGIINDKVQVILNDTKSLQSEVLLIKIEAIYGGVKIYDSILVNLQIVINQTFDSTSILEELPNGTVVEEFSLPGFKDFEFVDCPKFIWKNNTVLTNQRLDRETESSLYYCRIKATPKNDVQCTLKDVGFVSIGIEDINDNPPVFSEQSYNGRVKENDPEAVIVFNNTRGQTITISTTDEDIPPNTNISYSLSARDALPFSVTNINRTAVIRVKTNFTIDAETKDSYTFIIEATDGTNQNSATVTIEVIDVNEPAKFPEKIYTFDVSENDSYVLVGNVIAIDEDTKDEYRENEYKILSGSFGFFKIENNGSLFLKNTAGQKQSLNFDLIISVSDENLPQESQITTVKIHVNDVNESPKFNKSKYNFEVLEGETCQTNVGQVNAYDVDLNGTANAMFQYRIEAQKFKVDNETGIITCTNPFDYEIIRTYELEVIAVDKGSPPLSSTTKVSVQILDVNDNKPVLDVGSGTQILCSNIHTEGKPVAVVRGSDIDSGLNGQVTYSITTSNNRDIFDIDANGLIFVKKDNNLQCSTTYTIEIICSDKGNPPLSVKRELPVSVLDQGVTGIFNQSEFTLNITEELNYFNIPLLDLSIYLNPPTANLTIDGFVNGFSLINKTFIVNGKFDREQQNKYRIILKATYLETKSDIALLNISVIDVNDNEPVIANKNGLQFMSINEKSGIGSFLTKVQVSDADEGENAVISYSLLTRAVPFIISNTSGNITTSQSLDREKTSTYKLQVIARDRNFSDTVTIDVEITDDNDNHPVIQDPRSNIINVTENKVQEAILITVTDADTSTDILNINLNTNCPFNLSLNNLQSGKRSGELIFKNPLDYEERTMYECLITATDGKFFTNKTLVINVIDANDNSPVFHNLSEEIDFDVRKNLGYILISEINATDADSGSNGEITFSVEPKDGFDINKTTGQISFKQDKMQQDTTFDITITATDGGIPPKSTEVKIHVQILNDRPRPIFLDVAELKVKENNIFPNVYTVKANITLEEEDGQCGEMQYSIKGESTNFTINETSGIISLTEKLDREAFPRGEKIKLIIEAKTDCDDFRTSSSITLNITIEDENDNKPECSPPQPQPFSISQSLSINKIVGYVNANDKDGEYNGIQNYFDTSNSEYFYLESRSGEIALKKKFQTSRKTETYQLSVTVTDPDFNAHCDITITVKPDNFNGPVFLKDEYTTSLDINANGGEVLVVDDLIANDADNDPIKYSLEPNQGFFRINSSIDGPIITLKSDFKADVQTVIILKVFAEDDVTPIKTGTCTIKITIEGQTCLEEDIYNGIQDDAAMFQILFYSMVSALSLSLVLLVIVCYKWRTSNRDKTQMKSYYKTFNHRPRPYDQIAQPDGYDYFREDRNNFGSSVLDAYPKPVKHDNPMYVRAILKERGRFDNVSPRSSEPPTEYKW